MLYCTVCVPLTLIFAAVNFLLLESLERYYFYYGDDLQVECPTGSGNKMNLLQVSQEICRRIVTLFVPDENGRRPCHGDDPRYTSDPFWKDLVLFYEYFNGDTGKGCGARYVCVCVLVLLILSILNNYRIAGFFNGFIFHDLVSLSQVCNFYFCVLINNEQNPQDHLCEHAYKVIHVASSKQYLLRGASAGTAVKLWVKQTKKVDSLSYLEKYCPVAPLFCV